MKAYLYLAEGFEEIEALATVDVLRRGGVEVVTVSVNHGNQTVDGAHRVPVKADALIENCPAPEAADWMIFPGGLPGSENLAASPELQKLMDAHYAAGGHFAAICAAPAFVLGPKGWLEGHKVTCYPGCEPFGDNITVTGKPAEADGRFVTGRGPAAAIPFALLILAKMTSDANASSVAKGMLWQ